jgi:YgiT-type zinc finger domain-containing protein
MQDELVTYTLEFDGKIVVVEHVPARVDSQTGERFFAPETVERLQQVVWEQQQPTRIIETLVFEFAT